MIENDLQYRVTQEQAARLEAGLARMNASQPSAKDIDPTLLEMAKADVRGLFTKLYSEIAVYEAKHRRSVSDEHGIDSAAEVEPRRAKGRSRGADGC